MSEIQRFDPCDECSCLDMSDRQGLYVLFTDHEAAIALTARMCVEAFDAELARTEERVLADAKARIEAQRWGHNPETPPRSNGVWNQAIDAALAALTQPQSEEPGPYAKAFRERVCPVPEFPGIEKEDA